MPDEDKGFNDPNNPENWLDGKVMEPAANSDPEMLSVERIHHIRMIAQNYRLRSCDRERFDIMDVLALCDLALKGIEAMNNPIGFKVDHDTRTVEPIWPSRDVPPRVSDKAFNEVGPDNIGQQPFAVREAIVNAARAWLEHQATGDTAAALLTRLGLLEEGK